MIPNLDDQQLRDLLNLNDKLAGTEYTIISAEEFSTDELYRTDSPDNEADYDWVDRLYEVTVEVTNRPHLYREKIVITIPNQEWQLVHSFRE